MVKNVLALTAALAMLATSASGQARNAGTLLDGAVEYAVSVESGGKRLGFVFTNRTNETLYLEKRDAPWDSRFVLRLLFHTDLYPQEEPPDWQKGDNYFMENSHLFATRSYAIKPGESVGGALDLALYYPQVSVAAARSEVFLLWSMRLRVYRKDPDTILRKLAEPRQSERFGGFLSVAGKKS